MVDDLIKSKCTGCTACFNACPRDCISMTEDNEGFLYPIIDDEKCINCNRCVEVCPLNCIVKPSPHMKTFCIQNKNCKIRSLSSAGGAAGAIFESIFDSEGIVVSAGFDTDNNVKHYAVKSIEECLKYKILSSKYVPSLLNGYFRFIKNRLEHKVLVCFVGLPCQVAGLRSFLGKDYSNLILIDLTCYGVPSPKLYRKYINYCQTKYGSKIKSVNFRDKSYGYSAPSMSIELENGNVFCQRTTVKSFLRCFFANLSIRPSCANCYFKTIDRISDITLGDCKNIGEFSKKHDDDKGTTVAYVHSEKGANILRKISDYIDLLQVDTKMIIDTCGSKMVRSVCHNPKRKEFFSEIDSLEYNALIHKYCPPTLREKIASIFKPLLKLFGLDKLRVLKILKEKARNNDKRF